MIFDCQHAIILLGQKGNQFVLSRVGKNCENSIKNESLCRESATLLKDSIFATSNNGVSDLPYGCILDKTDGNNHYIFFNPNGVVRSADPQVREICLITEDPLEGKKLINKLYLYLYYCYDIMEY